MWKGVDVVSTHLEPVQRSGYMVFPVGGRRGFARLPAGRSGQDGAGNEGKDGAGRLYDKARCGVRIKKWWSWKKKSWAFAKKWRTFGRKSSTFCISLRMRRRLAGNSAIGVEQGELIARSFFNSPAHVDYNLRPLVCQSCAISSIGIQRKARKWRSGAKKGHYACVGAKKIGQSRVHVKRNAYICTIIWPRFGIR